MRESDAEVLVTGAVVPELGDEGWIARAQAGDRDAFAYLIEPRADRLVRTARAILQNEAEARDAAQDALVSAWVSLRKLRDVERFDAWLNRILVNHCRETLRRRKRHPEVELESPDTLGGDSTAGSLDTESLRAAFGRISVDDRNILLLHHLHGLPLNQVARQLQIPVGTAKSRLWRARRGLERAMEAEA